MHTEEETKETLFKNLNSFNFLSLNFDFFFFFFEKLGKRNHLNVIEWNFSGIAVNKTEIKFRSRYLQYLINVTHR